MVTDPLANRTMSAFPLSVGTSLCMESIFKATEPSIDPLRIIPQQVKLSDYSEFWINLSTLFRNMMGALSKEGATSVSSVDMKDSIIGEIDVIQSLIMNEGLNQVKPVFYASEYLKLQTKFNKFVVLRKEETLNQKIYKALHDQTIKLLLKDLQLSDNLRVYDSELNNRALNLPKSLIITHVAYDLLSHKNFEKLEMIESHTGVLKTRNQWHTKFLDGKELPMIPFLESMLCVFGDKETFRPMDIKLRRDVIELAKEHQWNSLTTKARVRLNIEFLKNPYAKEVLKSII